MISKREAEKGKAHIKQFLLELGGKILNENENDNLWSLTAQMGNFTVVFNHKAGLSSAVAIFPVNIQDEALLTPINVALNDPKKKAQFTLGLHSVLTTPVTTYSFNVTEGKFKGFSVVKTIFPFHSVFSIKELDSVLNAVISIGNLGIIYLQTATGENGMQQKISERVPSQDGMFA